MYCNKCGTQNPDDASFCGKCGNDLKSSKVETETKEIIGIIYCPKCGTENKDDVNFCSKCGNDLKSPKVETERKEIGGKIPNKMFNEPFSFDGRIRRSEFGISYIIYVFIAVIINIIAMAGRNAEFVYIAYIPLIWFLLSQGSKRCHDRGNSGWYQLIPFYALWMLFGDSEKGTNQYGQNPKGIEN